MKSLWPQRQKDGQWPSITKLLCNQKSLLLSLIVALVTIIDKENNLLFPTLGNVLHGRSEMLLSPGDTAAKKLQLMPLIFGGIRLLKVTVDTFLESDKIEVIDCTNEVAFLDVDTMRLQLP